MVRTDAVSALKAGILGTAIMTIVMYGLPLVGLPLWHLTLHTGLPGPLRYRYRPSLYLCHRFLLLASRPQLA